MAVSTETQSKVVEIFGMRYPLQVGIDEVEMIEEIAKYVDSEMRKNSSLKTTEGVIKVAVIAALNITSELFKERNKSKYLKELIESKTQEILELPSNFDS